MSSDKATQIALKKEKKEQLDQKVKKQKKEKQIWGINDLIRRVLLPYFWPAGETRYKCLIIACLGSMVVASMIGVAIPMALRSVFNSIQQQEQHADKTLDSFTILVLGLYLFMRLCSTFITDLRDSIFLNVSNTACRRVLLEAFAHIHELSHDFHTKRRTGALLKVIEKGFWGINILLLNLLFTIGPAFLEVGMVSLVLFTYYGPFYSILTIVSITLYSFWTLYLATLQRVIRVRMNETEEIMNERIMDSLLNFEAVKYFTAEVKELNRYDRALLNYTSETEKLTFITTSLHVGQGLIMTSTLGLAMWLSLQNYMTGNYSVGDLVAINGYFVQLWSGLNGLAKSYRGIARAHGDIEKMIRLLDEPVTIRDIPSAIDFTPLDGQITFENVSFAYDNDDSLTPHYLLKNVSFNVPGGKSLAIVGLSGAGKSTTFRLLCRFYDVGDGRILIDGKDIRTITKKSLRKTIGVVPQDTVLFNDTIAYNIAYGDESLSLLNEPEKDPVVFNRIIKAAKDASIHEFIESLPQGYSTLVGERGIRLSGGERQRVAIARTLMKDPKILILDEATSSLDSFTEASIQSSLEEISQGRTTIMIAHRLSTIVKADHIIVLRAGEIVEQGNHDQLLEEQGEYFKLWEH